jgi:hypothetical protein
MKTKMWTLMAGIAVSALTLGASVPAHAGTIDLAVSTSPYTHAVAEIEVDGPTSTGRYTEVRTKTLDYIVSVRSTRKKRFKTDGEFFVNFNGIRRLDGMVSSDWKNYEISGPYVNPRSHEAVNGRVSPVDICNQNLDLQTKLGQRDEFLKEGLAFLYQDAYDLVGGVSYGLTIKIYFTETRVPVRITCMPLDRPRPRENSETKGPPPREGKPMKPTISEVGLRVEPMQITQMGKFLCPAQLRLYGKLEVIRDFTGKSVFVGPHYLSAINDITLKRGVVGTVTATYPMIWHKMGDKAVAPNAAPAKQKLTFRYNVANEDGKVLESAERTIEVSCSKIAVNAPTAGGGMTVNPAN